MGVLCRLESFCNPNVFIIVSLNNGLDIVIVLSSVVSILIPKNKSTSTH